MDDNRIVKGLMLALIVCVPFIGLWAVNRGVFALCVVGDFLFLVIYWGIGWEETHPYQTYHQNESRESRVWNGSRTTYNTQTQPLYPKRESYEQYGYEPESKK